MIQCLDRCTIPKEASSHRLPDGKTDARIIPSGARFADDSAFLDLAVHTYQDVEFYFVSNHFIVSDIDRSLRRDAPLWRKHGVSGKLPVHRLLKYPPGTTGVERCAGLERLACRAVQLRVAAARYDRATNRPAGGADIESELYSSFDMPTNCGRRVVVGADPGRGIGRRNCYRGFGSLKEEYRNQKRHRNAPSPITTPTLRRPNTPGKWRSHVNVHLPTRPALPGRPFD